MRRLLAVAVVAVTTSACSVQTLGAPKGGLEFEAEFADVQTLVVGHSVQVSDVRIGTVTGISLDRDFHTHVTMELEPGRHLPQGVSAAISRTSLLGENYVKIILPPGAGLDTKPSLRDGAVITQTSVQPDMESISEKVGPVLAALGGSDLGEIVDAVSTAVRDKGPELNKLIKQITDISDSYAAAAKDLQTSIDGLARLGDSLQKRSGDLDRVPGRLVVATDRVERDRKELKSAVQELVSLGEAFNSRVHARHAARLRTLLIRLDRILRAMLRGKEDLKRLVRGLNQGLLDSPPMTYKGQILMHVWIGGIIGIDADYSHYTAHGGWGEKADLSITTKRALSPVTPKEK